MRLAYFVHGRGRGHAARASSTVPALRAAGHRVQVFASADAVAPLAELGEVREVALCDRGPTAAWKLARRAWSDRRRMKRDGTDAVITDGDPAGALAGRASGLPVVSVGHGLVFRHCALPDAIGLADRLAESLNAATTDAWADHHIPVHFLPAEPRRPGVTVARADTPGHLPASPSEAERGPFLLAYFSRSDGGAVVSALARRGRRVVWFDPVAVDPPGGEARRPDRRDFADHLARCDGVVCTAGSNLLAEAILLGRPMLALHPERHREQRLNAALVEAAGVGMAGVLPCPPSRAIDGFLRRLDAGSFRRVDLAAALPPVSAVLVRCVERLARER